MMSLSVDKDIKKKIDALLVELRSWEDDGTPRPSIQALAEKHKLTKFIVSRIAIAEGIDVPGAVDQKTVDTEADTQPLDLPRGKD